MTRKKTPAPKPVPPPEPEPKPVDESAWHRKLRRLVDRKAKGRTDAQIGALVNIKASQFSQLLSGRIADPRLSTIDRILKAIDATWTDYDRA